MQLPRKDRLSLQMVPTVLYVLKCLSFAYVIENKDLDAFIVCFYFLCMFIVLLTPLPFQHGLLFSLDIACAIFQSFMQRLNYLNLYLLRAHLCPDDEIQVNKFHFLFNLRIPAVLDRTELYVKLYV